MNSDENIEVLRLRRKAGSAFRVENPTPTFIYEDPAAFLLNYIKQNCDRRVEEVDWGESSGNREVYISRDDPDVGFTIRSSSNISYSLFSQEQKDAIELLIEKHLANIQDTEALSESDSIQIWPNSLRAPISRIDAAGWEPFKYTTNELLRHQRSVIYGAAGSGKTTLLRRMAFELADRNLSDFSSRQMIPIYLPLRALRESNLDQNSIYDLLYSKGDEQLAAFVKENIGEGLFFFFFDGLDEISSYQREGIVSSLNALATQHPHNSYMISTRPDSIESSLEGFARFQIDDWDDRLIRRWCYENLKNENSWKSFFVAIQNSSDLKSVVRNPLALAVAAYLFNRYSSLPNRASDIFEEYLRSLVEDWDRVRGIHRSTGKWQSPKQKVAVLCYIAYALSIKGDYTATMEQLDELIGHKRGVYEPGFSKLLASETSVLSSTAGATWQFRHHAIRDFLCSKYLVDSGRDIDNLIDEFGERLEPSSLIFAVSEASDPDYTVNKIICHEKISTDDKLNFAISCFSNNIQLTSKSRKELYGRVERSLDRISSVCRIEHSSDGQFVMSITQSDEKNKRLAIEILRHLSRVRAGQYKQELLGIAEARLSEPWIAIVNFLLRYDVYVRSFVEGGVSKINLIRAKSDSFYD